jgi:hypothetical protein
MDNLTVCVDESKIEELYQTFVWFLMKMTIKKNYLNFEKHFSSFFCCFVNSCEGGKENREI